MPPRPSILALREFYSSPLGRRVKQVLRQQLLDYWPNHTELNILGVGYAPPVLRVLERDKPAALLALMAADQGAIYWPVHSHNRSILGDLDAPPLRAQTMDRVVMLHGLEWAEDPAQMLQIYWDILVPGGRLVVVMPHRRGLWARFGHTPFRCAAGVDVATLKQWLFSSGFTLRDTRTALFAPPTHHPLWLRIFPMLEWLGRWLFSHHGGVVVVEAEKQIYAGLLQPLPARPRVKAWQGAVAARASHCMRADV